MLDSYLYNFPLSDPLHFYYFNCHLYGKDSEIYTVAFLSTLNSRYISNYPGYCYKYTKFIMNKIKLPFPTSLPFPHYQTSAQWHFLLTIGKLDASLYPLHLSPFSNPRAAPFG